jgi:hypothetical protein
MMAQDQDPAGMPDRLGKVVGDLVTSSAME